MAAGAEASGDPALFPFLTDGDTRRLGRHFANCVKLGEWELVSEPLPPSVLPIVHPHSSTTFQHSWQVITAIPLPLLLLGGVLNA